jgi:dTDP-glucose 4,6-dehydratase
MVTGGCGFIGSTLVLHLLDGGHEVLTFDAMTYAASPDTLAQLEQVPGHQFMRGDVCDADAVRTALSLFRPDWIVHLAAETHVDRSITGPGAFLRTNVMGTQTLLDVALHYWRDRDEAERAAFRLVLVSTDEVFGSLAPGERATELSRYDPRSPYAASKAAADHLACAWHQTYGLPVIVTNCVNNFGPRQFPEKLVPLAILNAIEGRPIGLYGDGLNIRDWIHCDDHASAVLAVLEEGRIGESYVIGARAEMSNLEIVRQICRHVDNATRRASPSERLITFVTDRPGHDRRYAVDPSKLERHTGWTARLTFEDGLRDCVAWYLANPGWWQPLRRERYGGERLGIAAA